MLKGLFNWLLVSLFVACSNVENAHRSLFRIPIAQEPPTLDPAYMGDTSSFEIGFLLYRGLLKVDRDLSIKGDLSYRWEKVGRHCTMFYLRNSRFSDGSPITSEDVVFSFRRIMDKSVASTGQWVIDTIALEKVYGVGSNRVVLCTKRYVPFFLYVLTMPYFFVVKRDNVRVYSGPYRLYKKKFGDYIWLKKNPYYYNSHRYFINDIEFKIIPNENIAFLKFLRGDFDVSSIPPAFIEKVFRDRSWNPKGIDWILNVREHLSANGGRILKISRLATYYIAMNNRKYPFNNKLFRESLNYAISKKRIVLLKNGRAIPSTGVLPPQFKSKIEYVYKYDLTKAKELLKKSGVDPKTLKLKLYYNTAGGNNPLGNNKQEAEYIQDALAKLGISVDIEGLEWGTYLSLIRKEKLDFFRLGWAADYPDPDNFLYTLLSSKNIGRENVAKYSNKEFDRLVELGREESNASKRLYFYLKAERIAIDDAPWIFTYHPVDYRIVQKGVLGFSLHPIYITVMEGVRK